MIELIRKIAIRVYSRLLFWKWDRDYHAAVERMRGCSHKHTVFVDVGTICEKCSDCWALRVPKLGSSTFDEIEPGTMEWTPNSADPRRARQVAPPNTRAT